MSLVANTGERERHTHMTEPRFSDLSPTMRDELLADVRDELLLRAAEQIGLPNVAAAVKKIANLREYVLKQSALPEERVHVPEWDSDTTECWILVRSLTAKERAQFMRRLLAQQPGQPAQVPGQPVSINWERYAVDIVLMTARDPEDGALLFSPTDRDVLLDMPAKPVETLASAARRLSGLEDGAQSDARFPDNAD